MFARVREVGVLCTGHEPIHVFDIVIPSQVTRKAHKVVGIPGFAVESCVIQNPQSVRRRNL